jgi:ankyrin repeat protein
MENLVNNLIKTLPNINSVDDEGNNIIHHFAQYGDLDLMRKVVKKNDISISCLLNQRNQDGNTPLHLAVGGGNQKLADYLVQKGANPEICNFKGEKCLQKNNLKIKNKNKNSQNGGGSDSESEDKKIIGTRKI